MLAVVRHVAALFLLPILVVTLSNASEAATQDSAPVRLRVEVRAAGLPVAGAAVRGGDVAAVTDVEGVATLDVPVGPVAVTVEAEGFLPATAAVTLAAGPERRLRVELTPRPDVDEEITVVATTRTGRRVEDQPMRVEVLGREEIEEKMLMTPGDIVMMLNEMGGLRVQTTSPSLGAASVRIQGMRGRYTRFLSDGLPLFGEQPGGLGLLQIPPMDLAQVEVIKGIASALYGAGAMGGVVNLLSRQPGDEPEHEVLVNQSGRGASDAILFMSRPLSADWGMTLLASGHRQSQFDADDDGWADMAGYTRGVVRPRVIRDDGRGNMLFATAGLMAEARTGGTVSDGPPPAATGPYREALDTTRWDAGLVSQTIVSDRYVLVGRAAVAGQRHEFDFGGVRERDRHTTAFGELSLRGAAGRHTWVVGAAVEHDRFRPIDTPSFAYEFTTPGVFAQDDIEVASWLTVSASGRVDRHSEYGTFVSPRVSALVRAHGWTGRVSAGGGYFGPTPVTEETEAAGLSRLEIPDPLEAETGRSTSVDIGRTGGPLSYTLTFFSSRIAHPVVTRREDRYALVNLDEPTSNRGVELLATWRRGPFAATGTYTYVRSRETVDGVSADVPLTPRHAAGLVAMVESEETGRAGLEVYVTGRQRLEANPLRDVSEPYVIVGLLAERRFGRVSLFINGENLTNVRQSTWHSLLRPARTPDGRWTVDAWAPLEGRVVNGGVRVRF
jgi:iron complex outermembrane receptor protein